MNKLKLLRVTIKYCLVTLLFLEVLSLIAVNLVHASHIAYPWDFITVASYGFVMPIIISIGLTIILFTCIYILHRIAPHIKLHQPFGNAHFASNFEISKAGFYKKTPESILLRKKQGAPLYANGFEHVLVFAPTGSGKTTSISIPNLFQFPYSCVVNDVKLTLFNTTSKYREQVLKNRCYCLILSNSQGRTHRYNPLNFVAQDPLLRMTDIQRMAHILIPDGKDDPIWYQSSRKLFKVLVLYLLDNHEIPATLANIGRIVKQPSFDAWLADKLENTDNYDPEFYRNGFSYLNNHPKTRSSILETFSGYFELFDDPLIDAATSASDFDITKLRQEKMTIYVGFSNDDMQRLSPLLTLFWEQVIGVMIREVPKLELEPYPVLCLIDEFSSLGKIDRLRCSLSLLREYRVRCVLMPQYLAQTYERYTHDEAKAFTNIKTKIAFTPDSLDDGEWISKTLGTKTLKINSGSTSSHHQGESHTQNFNYQAAPLMRPDEVMQLPKHQSLIMRAGCAPIKAQQWMWYKESAMQNLNYGAVMVPVQVVEVAPFVRLGLLVPVEE